jgi:drug/metabolite transporter (DMT)-like permease
MRATFSNTTAVPVLALLLNALAWGVAWWPFRQLQSLGLHPLWATACIYGLAASVIGLWRPQALGQVVRLPSLWGILIASGLTNAAFNWAVSIGDVVRMVLLFYLMPLWSLLLARRLLGEAVTAGACVRAVLAVVGAACVLAGPAAAAAGIQASSTSLDDALALLAGFAFALNTVLLRRAAAVPREGRAMAMFLGGALVAGAAATLLSGAGDAASLAVTWPGAPAAWVVPVAGLALAFLIVNLCLQYAVARLSARVTAVVLPCEVLFAAVTAVWWGGASLHLGLVVGGVCILSAAMASVWGHARAASNMVSE